MSARQTQQAKVTFFPLAALNSDSTELIKHLSTVELTAESWRRELKRSFQVTAALRKASWRRMSCSASSVWAGASPPSGCLEVISGSLAFSQASALTVSWANWKYSCSGGDSRPTRWLPLHRILMHAPVEICCLHTVCVYTLCELWWWLCCCYVLAHT